MNQSKLPIWKKSMLRFLNVSNICDILLEIQDNGDMHGYDYGESGYYQDYKELFDELSEGAYILSEALEEWGDLDLTDNWNDMAVTLLGYKEQVLGYETVEADYFAMCNTYEEDLAVQEAEKRITRLTKDMMIKVFRKVLITLTLFYDIKAAHDCLTSIVYELDQKGALLSKKNDIINQLYDDLTGKNGEDFDQLISQLPQRMWIE